MMSHWSESLGWLRACPEAMTFVRGHDTAQAAWDACKRGDWMLWWIGRRSGKPWSEGRRKLVLAAVECARLVFSFFEDRCPHDTRPRQCLDLFERWARNENIARQTLMAAYRAAADAAYAATAAAADSAADTAEAAAAYSAAEAAYAAGYAAAASTTYSAGYSAYCAYAAAYSAAADAAYAAGYATADSATYRAAADAAYAAALECSAQIVRRHYPHPPEE